MIEQLAKPWGELALYHDFALKMSNGLLPYKDFYPEYPPLSLLFFRLPLIFGTRYYMLTYYALISIFLILTVLLIRRLKGNGWAFISVLVLGGLFWDRFDIFPAFLSLLAVAYMVKKKATLAYITLSLGFLTKIYPLLLLPVFLVYTFRDNIAFAKHRIGPSYFPGIKKAFGGIVIFSIPIAIVLHIILGYGGRNGLIKFAEFQGNRGLHVESIRATIPLIQHLQGTRTFETVYSHNTFELIEKRSN